MKKYHLSCIALALFGTWAEAQVIGRPIRPLPGQVIDNGGVPEVPKKPRDEYLKDLKEKDKRLPAVLGLMEHFSKDAEPAIADLVSFFSVEDEDLRLNAAICLGKIGKPAVGPVAEQLNSKNDDVRFYALWTLGWIGPDAKSTSSKVIEALGDKNDGVRRKAVYALGKISPDPKEAVAALLKALEDPNGDVRTTAAEAIAPFGEKAVPGIIKILEKAPEKKAAPDAKNPPEAKVADPKLIRIRPGIRQPFRPQVIHEEGQPESSVQQACVHALELIGPAAKDAVPILTKLLKDQASTYPHYLMEALGKIGKDAIPSLMEAVKTDDPNIANVCIQTLQKITPEAAPHLVDLLGDKRANVRQQAASGLGTMMVNDKMVVIGLAFALKDSDDSVRQMAMQSLAQMGAAAKPAAPQINEALSDINPNTRNQAYWVLQQIGENPKSGLMKALDSKNERIRIATAALMVQVNFETGTAKPILLEALTHKDLDLKMQAAQSLAQGRIEAAKVVPIFIQGLEDANSNIRQQAMQGIQNYGNQAKDALPALMKILEGKDENMAQQAIWTVQNIQGDPKILYPVLLKLAQGKNQNLRIQAIQVLANSPSPESGDELIKIFKASDNAETKNMILQQMAYGRNSKKVIPFIKENLQAKDAQSRLQAVQMLSNINVRDKDTMKVAADLIKDENANIRLQACYQLSNFGATAFPLAEEAIQTTKDSQTRQALVQFFSAYNYQGTGAMPGLIECLKDSQPNVRLQTVQLLARMGAKAESARPLLEELAEKDADQNVRRTAKEALKKVVKK